MIFGERRVRMKDLDNQQPFDLLHHKDLVKTLINLPHKILHHHEVDGLAQIVLHELGFHLGLRRASYLIDNPDFSCLRGIAGYCQKECKVGAQDLWKDPHGTALNIDQTIFHSQIKQFLDNTVKRQEGVCQIDELQKLGKTLGINDPKVHTWTMRHGNLGVLIFEEDDDSVCKKAPDVLEHAVALLGLCPV